ncbi:MAG: phosphoglucosamine mutase [Rhodobacteraceae bacterium]|nr:phosphoglucosamine mutase [Paracoccaceae bacterium]
MSNDAAVNFGTDGIRGRANSHPMTAECALRIGLAAGRYFRRTHSNGHRVVIGKDTRRSGYMLENALTAGLTATGMNVLLLGPVPTPAVGLLTRSMRADLGVMISASHNPYFDNGIKFFGPDGFKLAETVERDIERWINAERIEAVDADNIGRAMRVDDGLGRYVEFVKTTFPKRLRLNRLRIVVDCANGAAYRVAPEVLWELGAEVIPVGDSPNGYNINEACGSTNPELAKRKVLETRADAGICLDGDADRVVVIDEKGNPVCGDQILALLAQRWFESGRLAKNTLVATVMSNFGMELHLNGKGIGVKRTSVGDRNVMAAMREGGFNVGGEQSGHIVLSDHVTTGDGLVSGLQFLAALVELEKPASSVSKVFEALPQTLINVPFREGCAPLADETVRQTARDVESSLKGHGRLVVRQSGTEPVVRIMVESDDAAKMRVAAEKMATAVAGAA